MQSVFDYEYEWLPLRASHIEGHYLRGCQVTWTWVASRVRILNASFWSQHLIQTLNSCQAKFCSCLYV